MKYINNRAEKALSYKESSHNQKITNWQEVFAAISRSPEILPADKMLLDTHKEFLILAFKVAYQSQKNQNTPYSKTHINYSEIAGDLGDIQDRCSSKKKFNKLIKCAEEAFSLKKIPKDHKIYTKYKITDPVIEVLASMDDTARNKLYDSLHEEPNGLLSKFAIFLGICCSATSSIALDGIDNLFTIGLPIAVGFLGGPAAAALTASGIYAVKSAFKNSRENNSTHPLHEYKSNDAYKEASFESKHNTSSLAKIIEEAKTNLDHETSDPIYSSDDPNALGSTQAPIYDHPQ